MTSTLRSLVLLLAFSWLMSCGRGHHVNHDVNRTDEHGQTQLMLSAEKGDTITVDSLLAQGADPNLRNAAGNTALIFAIGRGHTPVVRSLLAKGADVNMRYNRGMTALILASQEAHKTIVDALLEKGADVNATDDAGQTALMAAVFSHDTDITEVLLHRGADRNVKRFNGTTAVTDAAETGNSKVMQLLGANENQQEDPCRTPHFTEQPNTVLSQRSDENERRVVRTPEISSASSSIRWRVGPIDSRSSQYFTLELVDTEDSKEDSPLRVVSERFGAGTMRRTFGLEKAFECGGVITPNRVKPYILKITANLPYTFSVAR